MRKKWWFFAILATSGWIITSRSFAQDFTFVVFPDLQNESQYNPAMLTSQMNWIVANKSTSWNVVFAASVGDLVNNANSTTEYGNADAAFDILDAGLVPYTVVPGNHDYPGYSTPLLWSTYFGTSRFTGKSWFGAAYDNYNSYSFFSASCNDFIVINLQYSPTTAILNWADALLKANPARRGIVVQHNILNVDNSWNSPTSYNALKDNPNLFLMLCGHMHTSTDGAAYRAELGDDGHTIHIVQADYQDMSYGNGYLRLLRFSPANDKIYMTTYSPYANKSITTSPDQMELVVDLNSATVTWDGSAGSNWSTAANWTPPNLPVACTHVTIPGSGITNFPVVSTTDAVCNNLSIEAKGQLTIQSGAKLTVSGQTAIQSLSPTDNGSLIVDGTLSPASLTYYRQLRSIAIMGITTIFRLRLPVRRLADSNQRITTLPPSGIGRRTTLYPGKFSPPGVLYAVKPITWLNRGEMAALPSPAAW